VDGRGAGFADTGGAAAGSLPELADVYWRRRADERSLRVGGRLWTLTTAAHTVPFVLAAVLLILLNPITTPVALAALAHAWVIPELHAARGANVVRETVPSGGQAEPQRVALGLLGDLLAHGPRELQARTGLVAERGRHGVWLLGGAGALLVRPGARRVHCYCVKASGSGLPPADRIAHLLLALREDEVGFATVANLAFSGAGWRVRRRLDPRARPALDIGIQMARDGGDVRAAEGAMRRGGPMGLFARGHTRAA
jgi:multisubunit Na+/H+ antiporter MnhG subunit